MEIKVTLQNGTIREVLQGTTIKEAAGAISTSLKKCCSWNNRWKIR